MSSRETNVTSHLLYWLILDTLDQISSGSEVVLSHHQKLLRILYSLRQPEQDFAGKIKRVYIAFIVIGRAMLKNPLITTTDSHT
jgi:hypothetical protein